MKSVKIALKTAATDDVHEAFEGLQAPKLRNFPNPAGEIRDFAETFRTAGLIDWNMLNDPFAKQLNNLTFTTTALGNQLAAGNLGGSGGSTDTWEAIGAGGTGQFGLQPGQLLPVQSVSSPTAWEKFKKYF